MSHVLDITLLHGSILILYLDTGVRKESVKFIKHLRYAVLLGLHSTDIDTKYSISSILDFDIVIRGK